MSRQNWRENKIVTPHKPRTAAQLLGDRAQAQALAHLQGSGLRLIEQNFCCRGGEIDLIMQDTAAQCLVFVEVRARTDAAHGGALASITARKQGRIVHASKIYLQSFKIIPNCRFDVLVFEGDLETSTALWLQNVIIAYE